MEISKLKNDMLWVSKVMHESDIIETQTIGDVPPHAEITLFRHEMKNCMIMCKFNVADMDIMKYLGTDICSQYSAMINEYLKCNNAITGGIIPNDTSYNAFVCIYFIDMKRAEPYLDRMTTDMLSAINRGINTYLGKCRALKSHKKFIEKMIGHFNDANAEFETRVDINLQQSKSYPI